MYSLSVNSQQINWLISHMTLQACTVLQPKRSALSIPFSILLYSFIHQCLGLIGVRIQLYSIIYNFCAIITW